jgi:hypothetical protein
MYSVSTTPGRRAQLQLLRVFAVRRFGQQLVFVGRLAERFAGQVCDRAELMLARDANHVEHERVSLPGERAEHAADHLHVQRSALRRPRDDGARPARHVGTLRRHHAVGHDLGGPIVSASEDAAPLIDRLGAVHRLRLDPGVREGSRERVRALDGRREHHAGAVRRVLQVRLRGRLRRQGRRERGAQRAVRVVTVPARHRVKIQVFHRDALPARVEQVPGADHVQDVAPVGDLLPDLPQARAVAARQRRREAGRQRGIVLAPAVPMASSFSSAPKCPGSRGTSARSRGGTRQR